MKIPSFSPIIVTKKTQIPREYIECKTGLPTYILVNRLGRKAFTHENAVDFWPEMGSWKKEYLDEGIKIKLEHRNTVWQEEIEELVPKSFANPIGFEGWQLHPSWLNTKQHIVPARVIYKKEDCIAISYKGTKNRQFAISLTTLPFKIEDTRIENLTIHYGSVIKFDVVGLLTEAEWEVLGCIAKPLTSYPCAYGDVIKITSRDLEIIPPNLYEELKDKVCGAKKDGSNIAYYIDFATILTLPEKTKVAFNHPSALIKDGEIKNIITVGSIHQNCIELKIKNALTAGLIINKIYWIKPGVIYFETKAISVWPQFRTECGLIHGYMNIRNTPQHAFLAEHLILDNDYVKANKQKDQNASIFIYKAGNSIVEQGIIPSNQKQNRNLRLEHIKQAIKLNPAIVKILGEVKDYAEKSLDAYIAAISIVENYEYVHLGYTNDFAWVRSAIPTQPYHLLNIYTHSEIESAFKSLTDVPKSAKAVLAMYDIFDKSTRLNLVADIQEPYKTIVSNYINKH